MNLPRWKVTLALVQAICALNWKSPKQRMDEERQARKLNAAFDRAVMP